VARCCARSARIDTKTAKTTKTTKKPRLSPSRWVAARGRPLVLFVLFVFFVFNAAPERT
jgi:hypothetical protein